MYWKLAGCVEVYWRMYWMYCFHGRMYWKMYCGHARMYKWCIEKIAGCPVGCIAGPVKDVLARPRRRGPSVLRRRRRRVGWNSSGASGQTIVINPIGGPARKYWISVGNTAMVVVYNAIHGGNSPRTTAGAPKWDEWKALYACYDRGELLPYHSWCSKLGWKMKSIDQKIQQEPET